MMARHHVLLAAFLVQPDQPSRALRLQVVDPHLQRRADAGKAVGEGGDQGPVAQIPHRVDRNGVDQPPPLLAFQHGRLAGLDHVLGPRTAEAGFVGTTWPVINQSNSIRTAASCCFTPGAAWVCWSVSI